MLILTKDGDIPSIGVSKLIEIIKNKNKKLNWLKKR